ncbi:hypothetical protein C7401_108189 [Paraburkholderia unamae]|uniref:hypothetical protein n=1 Tax=Paraburkholderia unamae TaxID=219649 RepID=UPI000DC2D215|nr:hypothetical protein [Paraburkholderia unamae]RAR61253.1 hypothetical protein C7401_108189 [Paraburkholderia unamae]
MSALRFVRSRPKVLLSLAAACALLAGCASSSDVSATDKQGVFVASASASGGRLAWARAHRRAMTEATDYCESRGMQPSMNYEHTAGIEAMSAHDSVIRFECHPKL